jgi:hypothetical protein
VWYPFVCYADFEASTKEVDGKLIQVPNSYVIFSPELAMLSDTQLSDNAFLKWHFSDNPENLTVNFIENVNRLHNSHVNRMTENAKVPRLTLEEQQKYNEAEICGICKKKFNTYDNQGNYIVKVRHHDHVTNKFIGALCSQCNLKENNKYFKTIVVFHNFSGYDGHFIIRYATKFLHDKNPYCFNTQKIISKSSEKIKHFQYGNIIFIDSMNHLNGSLDKLVDVLNKSGYGFPIFSLVGLHKILRSKGIYPYRWVDSIEKFSHQSLHQCNGLIMI